MGLVAGKKFKFIFATEFLGLFLRESTNIEILGETDPSILAALLFKSNSF